MRAVIDDAATPVHAPSALFNAGAVRQSMVDHGGIADGQRGIADITEGLRQHTPAKHRKQHPEHSGTTLCGDGPNQAASADFKAVLAEAPEDDRPGAVGKTETLDDGGGGARVCGSRAPE